MPGKRIIIIGGVAGGASAAARARRLSMVIRRGRGIMRHVALFLRCSGEAVDSKVEFCILNTEYGLGSPSTLGIGPRTMAAISRIATAPDITEQVYQRLLHAICDGELAPGARRMVWDKHEPILRAINRGDADRAERLAREHAE